MALINIDTFNFYICLNKLFIHANLEWQSFIKCILNEYVHDWINDNNGAII